jgi:hypothetical protein
MKDNQWKFGLGDTILSGIFAVQDEKNAIRDLLKK